MKSESEFKSYKKQYNKLWTKGPVGGKQSSDLPLGPGRFDQFVKRSAAETEEMLAENVRTTAASEEGHALRPLYEALIGILAPEQEHFAEERARGCVAWMDHRIKELRKTVRVGTAPPGTGQQLESLLAVQAPLLEAMLLDHCYLAERVQESVSLLEQRLSSVGRQVAHWTLSSNINRSDVNLKQEVVSIVRIHELAAEPGKFDFFVKVKTDKILRLDRRGFQSVFNHLLLNSREAIAEAMRQKVCSHGNIHVEVDELRIGADEYLRVTVEDNGIGIPEEQLQKLTTGEYSTKGPGHGKGLKIVEQIARWNSGFVTVQSIYRRGARVSVAFNLDLIPEIPVKKRSASPHKTEVKCHVA